MIKYLERTENIILSIVFAVYGIALTYLFYIGYNSEPDHIMLLIIMISTVFCFMCTIFFVFSALLIKNTPSPHSYFLTEERLLYIIAGFLYVLAFIFVEPTDNSVFDSMPNLFLIILATLLVVIGIIKRLRKPRCFSTHSEKDWNFYVRCQLSPDHSGKHIYKSQVMGTIEWGNPYVCKHLLGDFCHNPKFAVERCRFFNYQELCSCFEKEKEKI